MSNKRLVYLNEYNLLMNGSTYLPLVSGLLRAHAEQSPVVQERFAFAPFQFHNDRPDRIVGRHERPAVAAFSSLMWNAQLCLQVAEQVKRQHPECLVVFGGANVPHRPEGFLREHPFIDVAVRGEGEPTFTTVLEHLAVAGGDLDGVPAVTWRTPSGEIRFNEAVPDQARELDVYPSPYLNGLYDDLFVQHPELQFQAIIETNRGCPFTCTFCYWGKGGMSRKYRFHGLERVQREIDWMADKKIRYVFNADSNFGMHRRDMEIAQYLVDTKRRTGFPHKFRTCYGKNTDEKIFAIGKLFHEAGLEKGITISYQSVDAQVQQNIRRENIKLESARELQRRFNDLGVPVYTELILGLPGETLQTWYDGVDRVLGSGLKNQLFMYLCQVFPNTELADPEYLRRFGMRTQIVELQEIHGRVRAPEQVPEQEELVIATDAMPAEDWERAVLFSWLVMTLHSLKLGLFVLAWLVDRCGVRHSEFLCFLAEAGSDASEYPRFAAMLAAFRAKVERLQQGQGRGCVLPAFGQIYWDEEEAAFLRLSNDFDGFFHELRGLTAEFLEQRGVAFDEGELDEVVRYQSLAIPRPTGDCRRRGRFERDLLGYFEALFSTTPLPLQPQEQIVLAEHPDFAGDLPRFAVETILWGRKSGTMLAKLCVAPSDHERSAEPPREGVLV